MLLCKLDYIKNTTFNANIIYAVEIKTMYTYSFTFIHFKSIISK